jgi:N-acetyl sugar amidotransferase
MRLAGSAVEHSTTSRSTVIPIMKLRSCTNCVMDSTDSLIAFDADGVCDHCRGFWEKIRPNWHTGEKGRVEMEALAERIRREGKGRDFDCIIGMSGGIDSSYLTYLAATEMGLRPLIFHVDAGWNSQEAVNNIEKMIDGLNLDLFTEVIDWQEMRDLQLAFFKAGVPHIDTPQDHSFFATMYKFAEKYGVKYVLTGANYSTECVRNPLEWMYHQSDSRQIRDIHRQFGTRPLDRFPLTSVLWHKVYLPYAKGIRVVRPLNYLPYLKGAAIEFLENRFGWQRYPQKHFESRFTRFYEGYWLPTRFGYDTRKVQFSSLILTDQMSRDEAIARLSEPALSDDEARVEFDYVARKLDISPSELRGYLEAPKRTFREFKSQRAVYSVGAMAMRYLGLELGGKR